MIPSILGFLKSHLFLIGFFPPDMASVQPNSIPSTQFTAMQFSFIEYQQYAKYRLPRLLASKNKKYRCSSSYLKKALLLVFKLKKNRNKRNFRKCTIIIAFFETLWDFMKLGVFSFSHLLLSDAFFYLKV
jgi:hypothetical protein